jgi:hypothetical protein
MNRFFTRDVAQRKPLRLHALLDHAEAMADKRLQLLRRTDPQP